MGRPPPWRQRLWTPWGLSSWPAHAALILLAPGDPGRSTTLFASGAALGLALWSGRQGGEDARVNACHARMPCGAGAGGPRGGSARRRGPKSDLRRTPAWAGGAGTGPRIRAAHLERGAGAVRSALSRRDGAERAPAQRHRRLRRLAERARPQALASDPLGSKHSNPGQATCRRLWIASSASPPRNDA